MHCSLSSQYKLVHRHLYFTILLALIFGPIAPINLA
jgi:hypothetical protein